jgi:Ca2+-binding RTX toxin-like protein
VAVFLDVDGPVTVDLLSVSATGAGTDALRGFEDVWGTRADDVIVGSDVGNVLLGFAGADDLSGRGGDDVLRGGPGADRARGGAGVDVCFSVTIATDCEGP